MLSATTANAVIHTLPTASTPWSLPTALRMPIERRLFEITVTPVDPEHPERLTLEVYSANSLEAREMAEWLQEQAADYPRRAVLFRGNTVLTPYVEAAPSPPFILEPRPDIRFHFDRATQEKLAIYFRMRWS